MKAGFLTFEGIEGSGKSTQMELLAGWLTRLGATVTKTREPGGTRLGGAVRTLLLDPDRREMVPETELFLYLADRAQNVHECIVPALEAGRVVLCDRHTDATLVYQGVLRGLGVDRLRSLNLVATAGLVPDKTLLFDLPARVGLERAFARRQGAGGAPDRIENEPIEFHEGIRQAYLALAASEPGRIVVIDAGGTVAEVHARVVDLVGDWLKGRFLSAGDA